MHTKRKKTGAQTILALLLTVFFMVAGSLPVTAGGHGKASPWQKGAMEKHRHHRPPLGLWQDPELVEKLELTETQLKQLRDEDFASREKGLVLKAQLDRLDLELEKAFSADTVDQKAVRKLTEAIAEVRGNLFIQRIESRLTLGEILDADQMSKLQQQLWQGKKCDSKTGRKGRVRNNEA